MNAQDLPVELGYSAGMQQPADMQCLVLHMQYAVLDKLDCCALEFLSLLPFPVSPA